MVKFDCVSGARPHQEGGLVGTESGINRGALFILGLYRDNGKEHGNYYGMIRYIWAYIANAFCF